jgi:hypothetical protein
MTASVHQPDTTSNRHPLSCSQELWCAGHQLGAFGSRFIMAEALRIAGRIDVAALQGALDDLVVRHEILRTVVVRDADPPYQVVHPPSPVPLEVRDLPVAAGDGRDRAAEELLTEAELSTLDVTELPLLRAVLTRFDAIDSVLSMTTHHTSGDGWSMQLIKRDLAAFYRARTTGQPAHLPEALPYREYAAWQQSHFADGPSPVEDYWRRKLSGAQIFALPTDRPVPATHRSPYRAHNYVVGADVMERVYAVAAATRSSPFIVMLAAFNVLAHEITGTFDPVVNTLTAGRSQRAFGHTVGPFLDFAALRTGLAGARSFRDVLARTRRTCVEAFSHEIPINFVERDIPELMARLREPRNCDFIFGFFRPLFDRGQTQIADGTYAVRQREQKSPDIPGGATWTMGVIDSGEALGKVQFNPDEFDEGTIVGWATGYRRILIRALDNPDQDWMSL